MGMRLLSRIDVEDFKDDGMGDQMKTNTTNNVNVSEISKKLREGG